MIDAIPEAVFAWAGYIGVAFYLGAYGLLQAGFIRGNSLTYTFMNMAAATLVLVSLIDAFNLASAMIQISWIAISIAGIVRIALQSTWVRYSDEDRALIEAMFPDMPKPMARRLLDAGRWYDARPGDVLTTEGEPVTALHYLASGSAKVLTGSTRVADIRQGFVGEINVIEAGPASATVQISAPSRLFVIGGAVLGKLRDRDIDFRVMLDRALSQDTASKLVHANTLLQTPKIARATSSHSRS